MLLRKFRDLVGLIARGRFDAACDEALAEAIATLEALPTGQGKASITVTLDLAFQDGRMEVKPSLKSKLPEAKTFAGTPFWTRDGALSVEHPSQIDMFPARDAEALARTSA